MEKELLHFPDVFKITNDHVEINPELSDYDARSQVRDSKGFLGGHPLLLFFSCPIFLPSLPLQVALPYQGILSWPITINACALP